ncbi:MAG: hypothetical protein IIX23_02860 [Oscillospiraceae bacterium]|nr:hypothetical protein [Oscillospiraceae bacterium]
MPLDSKLTLRQAVLFGMLGSLTFAAKVAMAGLPNIEPASLFIMLFAVVFGKKCIYPIYTYVVMEFLCYGIHLWSINYLYVWLILAAGAWLLRSVKNPFVWALLSGGFGLLFGLFCAPVYLVSGGIGYAVSWWISGVPFDLLHAGGNFVMALVLFVPLRKLLTRLYSRI